MKYLALLLILLMSTTAFADSYSYGRKNRINYKGNGSIPSISFPLRGMNLAGMGFDTGTYLPTAEEITYFSTQGMGIIRYSFKWERMQPTLGAPFNSTYLNQLKQIVSTTSLLKTSSILDLHNYGKYNGNPIYSGTTQADFADFWTRMATEFKGDPYVIFDLMNEPYTLTAAQMGTAAQAAINAIRATGSKNWIMVEGGGSYASAAGFITSGWAPIAVTLTDPENKLIFQVHSYFDEDGSGTSSVAKTGTGVGRLTDATAYARSNGIKLFLGEFGMADNADMYTEGTQAMAYMNGNTDVWAGWTYWAAGPAWGNYMYSAEPSSFNPLIEAPQMLVIKGYLY